MNVIDTETTVGQLVVERPSRARVFEKLGIDYCCGGKRPLGEVCAGLGLDVEGVLRDLIAEEGIVAGDQVDWAAATMTELADHIEATHHAYLRTELPRLDFLTDKVASRHGSHTPSLIELRHVLLGLKDELTSHMLKEERILFPICRQLDAATELPQAHCGSVNNPIRMMEHEHDDAGVALARMRALTRGFNPPAEACNTYRALFDGLRELEADLHAHIHKENNILFPKAAAAEARLGG